jgi:hypothetical protein
MLCMGVLYVVDHEEPRLKFMEMSDFYGTHQTPNRSFANEFSRIMIE